MWNEFVLPLKKQAYKETKNYVQKNSDHLWFFPNILFFKKSSFWLKRKNPQKFWKLLDKFRSGNLQIWLLETMASTSQCLKQIFFWKKTIKVSGQSPWGKFPRTRDSETRKLSGPKQVAFKKNTRGPKRSVFRGHFGGSKLQKKT